MSPYDFLKETLGSKHILFFYFINTYPIELQLSEFECLPKRKAENFFQLFYKGIFPRCGRHF